MKFSQAIRRVLPVFVVTVGLMISIPVVSAATCKGMQKGACSSNNSCSWVDGYKTKTGSVVKAHCRAKPGNGSAKKSTASKSASSSKAKEAKKSASKKTTEKKAKTSKKTKDKAKSGS